MGSATDGGETCDPELHLPASTLLLIIIMSCCVNTNSQDYYDSYVVHPNQEVRIAALPSTVAASTSKSDVLVASVATAVMERDVCCGRNSALEDQIIAASASTGKISLRELGEKLRGKHYLDNGASIFVADQYWPAAPIEQNAVKPGDIISLPDGPAPIADELGRPACTFCMESYSTSAPTATLATIFRSIRTLLLIDTRFSGRRRYVSFNRQTDDWGKVTGVLALAITRNK